MLSSKPGLFWPRATDHGLALPEYVWIGSPRSTLKLSFADCFPQHRELSVDLQEQDPGSVLNGFRTFMRWRKLHPALLSGDICFLDLPESVLAFTRATADERLSIVFNLSRRTVAFDPDIGRLTMLNVPPVLKRSIEGPSVRIPGLGGAMLASVT
jgi:glycosidase